jgi:cell division protease FtsH
MAEALMKYETLDAGQVKDLMDRKSVKPPEGWNDNDKKSGTKSGKTKKASTRKPKPKSSGDIDSVTR